LCVALGPCARVHRGCRFRSVTKPLLRWADLSCARAVSSPVPPHHGGRRGHGCAPNGRALDVQDRPGARRAPGVVQTLRGGWLCHGLQHSGVAVPPLAALRRLAAAAPAVYVHVLAERSPGAESPGACALAPREGLETTTTDARARCPRSRTTARSSSRTTTAWTPGITTCRTATRASSSTPGLRPSTRGGGTFASRSRRRRRRRERRAAARAPGPGTPRGAAGSLSHAARVRAAGRQGGGGAWRAADGGTRQGGTGRGAGPDGGAAGRGALRALRGGCAALPLQQARVLC
jgi:hypothetical protein